MKNVTLVKSDNYILVAKIYNDTSIRFVQRWKGMSAMKDELYLSASEVDLLIENLKNNKLKEVVKK